MLLFIVYPKDRPVGPPALRATKQLLTICGIGWGEVGKGWGRQERGGAQEGTFG